MAHDYTVQRSCKYLEGFLNYYFTHEFVLFFISDSNIFDCLSSEREVFTGPLSFEEWRQDTSQTRS